MKLRNNKNSNNKKKKSKKSRKICKSYQKIRGMSKKLIKTLKRIYILSWRNHILRNFIQQSLSSGSAQIQILLAVIRRFAMMRNSDNGPS